MSRHKERTKIIHQPSTHELFMCLASMPSYSKILLEFNDSKSYCNFLKWLLQVNFYKDINERTTIKKIAADFKIDSPRVTKWINEIYEDILTLNFDHPELFQKDGIKLKFYMKYYDNYCTFYSAMPVVPREFETVNLLFFKGKVGEDHFWVKKVEHQMEEDTVEITVWLEVGFHNKYREFALDKALFQEEIGFMDVFLKRPFELDAIIRRIYRN